MKTYNRAEQASYEWGSRIIVPAGTILDGPNGAKTYNQDRIMKVYQEEGDGGLLLIDDISLIMYSIPAEVPQEPKPLAPTEAVEQKPAQPVINLVQFPMPPALPELKLLTGTMKQTEWAKDIRARTIEALLQRFARQHMPGAPVGLIERLRPIAIEAVNGYSTEARQWINPIGAYAHMEDAFWTNFEFACLRFIKQELKKEQGKNNG